MGRGDDAAGDPASDGTEELLQTRIVAQLNEGRLRTESAEMLIDFNYLLDKHSRGVATHEDFETFMAKHGEQFPAMSSPPRSELP